MHRICLNLNRVLVFGSFVQDIASYWLIFVCFGPYVVGQKLNKKMTCVSPDVDVVHLWLEYSWHLI